MDPLLGKTLSHYRIVEKVGAGGMGEVYRGRDTRLDRDVAVKTLPVAFSSDPGRVHRFTREAKIVASLNHPNIAAIYGLEELPSGERFLILEFVEGETLAKRLKVGALAIPEALRVCGAIAEALEAAHDRGVIHRDLKPANVMITARGVVKVLDFGLARWSGDSQANGATQIGTATALTEPGRVMGTPGYMSPEHVRGEEHDRRTDIFAFGCVLFECLTGRRAFGGATKMDAIAAVLNKEPPWSALPLDTPQPIRELIARCLEKDAGQRLRNIGDARIGIEGVHGGGPPARAPLSVTPHSLPKQLTSFVGREREISECDAILGEARLLTLTGIGGCGKTRLALEVAATRIGTHSDGIWFADLAPVSDPDRVPLAVATAVAVREEPGKPVLETLVQYLVGKRALLVLDNCEHVLLACASLSERLLASAPDLRLLATSRESLGVKGERPYPVGSLSVPKPDKAREGHTIETSEAVRLFEDRARVVSPDFQITERSAPIVAEICRQLDGLPLAIELAAARLRVLSVEQIRTKLDDRFRLLTGGSKTALPRNQTLRATIQWSYDQLSPEEQRFFRLLAVFAGGWTLAAAASVAGDGTDEFVALDHLTRLVDKSLVVVEREVGGEPRYRMLETVRQYALERLNESGEGDGARTRHLDFYLALAEKAIPRTGPRGRGEWYERFERERENVLSAHVWCGRSEGGAQKGLRLVGGVRDFWEARGLTELGYRVLREALSREGADSPTEGRALALRGAGFLAYRIGHYAEAAAFAEESLLISRACMDGDSTAGALVLLGIVKLAEADLAAARKLFEESITISREIGTKGQLHSGLNCLAEVFRMEGKLEAAARLYEESLALSRELGAVQTLVNALLNLASLDIRRGDFAAARAKLLESAALGEEIGSRRIEYGVLAVAVGFMIARSAWKHAARLYGVLESMLKQLAVRQDPADEGFLAPLIARARGELGESSFAEACDGGRALSYEQALAEARAWLEEL
jgi:predicted ATPase